MRFVFHASMWAGQVRNNTETSGEVTACDRKNVYCTLLLHVFQKNVDGASLLHIDDVRPHLAAHGSCKTQTEQITAIGTSMSVCLCQGESSGCLSHFVSDLLYLTPLFHRPRHEARTHGVPACQHDNQSQRAAASS